MSSLPPAPVKSPVTRFRVKLMVAMMLVVSAVMAVALYFAQRNLAENVERDMRRAFQNELAGLHRIQEIRYAALAERCRMLVRKPRIHAALEDGALDLLYPVAKDELRDVMEPVVAESPEQAVYALHAEFYRFLDRNGALIRPPDTTEVGFLRPAEAARLALPTAPQGQQIGYLVRKSDDGTETISEVIALPIFSSETGEAIAALVMGFKPVIFGAANTGIRRGIWVDGSLHMGALTPEQQTAVGAEIARAIAAPEQAVGSFGAEVAGMPDRFFFKRLNPDSFFPPAYEVCIYPLTELIARQQQLRWQMAGAGTLLLLAGLIASHFVSQRFSAPVEKLAVDSADNLAQRRRAEAALEHTTEELQRAARFSADASHQLKTPVTVLRAGLEELLAQENLTPEECHDISALIHQTYRLSSVIEDLLLLSRMDAGRLKIDFAVVDLSQLIEAALDDLSALPDEMKLQVETDFPSGLNVAGEKRYLTIIVQNLLENARKYNRPGGRIRIAARELAGFVHLKVGNTGSAIAPAAQQHIFERFHRGSMGENVPGYGLGLNLARELARLHRGEVSLLSSDDKWTEFEVRLMVFHAAPAGSVNAS
ncbi:MAG TPA: HAMP domain-containing sensor histidine kinase [Opitutaceae bacterium]|nr:HAMP domain-containing sensor histidine kinase [Opitutaceae bacterium]